MKDLKDLITVGDFKILEVRPHILAIYHPGTDKVAIIRDKYPSIESYICSLEDYNRMHSEDVRITK